MITKRLVLEKMSPVGETLGWPAEAPGTELPIVEAAVIMLKAMLAVGCNPLSIGEGDVIDIDEAKLVTHAVQAESWLLASGFAGIDKPEDDEAVDVEVFEVGLETRTLAFKS